MRSVEQPTHVDMQCFRCDHVQRKKLTELDFGTLRDYRCPKCGLTGCTHVIAVKTAIQMLSKPLTARVGVGGRGE